MVSHFSKGREIALIGSDCVNKELHFALLEIRKSSVSRIEALLNEIYNSLEITLEPEMHV